MAKRIKNLVLFAFSFATLVSIFHLYSFYKKLVTTEKQMSSRSLEFPHLINIKAIINQANCNRFSQNLISLIFPTENKSNNTSSKVKRAVKTSLSKTSNTKKEILGYIVIDSTKFCIIEENGNIKLSKYTQNCEKESEDQ